MRIYEYAKQLNMTSKEILTILKRLNFKVSNHMSVMDEQMMQQVEQFFKDIKQKADAKQQKPANEKTAEVKKHDRRKGRPTGRQQQKRTADQKDDSPKPHKEKGENARQAKAERNVKGQPSKTDETKKNRGKPRRFNGVEKSGAKEQQGKGRKGGTRKRNHSQPAAKTKPATRPLPEKIEVEGSLTVAELAKTLHREPTDIIKKLMALGIMATINQELDMDAITLVADEYGVAVEEKVVINEEAFEEIVEDDDPKDLRERPPVVTIMGHVDHGKTTLLDSIRETKVATEEAGGITQHIGAYQVKVNGKLIAFLDTPGHEAFTTMRARGAKVTDITILVVAADDGVMPQTVEAINHAKAADVPIIVAINKIDKPEANPDRIKQELTEHGLVPEEWGGDTIFVPISALQHKGIDELLEMVLLVAEMQELKANPNKRARGTVIEAQLDKGRGPVATVLVQNGTLKVGDALVAGNFFGKVRAMVNDRGRRVKEAGPSTPVEVLGLSDVPNAGDAFMVFEDEKKARAIAEARATKQRQAEFREGSRVNLDALFKQIQEGEVRELAVIIKADVQGSVEALRSALEKIDIEGVKVNIIHSGVGAITESDVILASASNAIIIGFNVRPEPTARVTAEAEKVDIRLYRVIYDAISEIEQAMTGLLDPEYEEQTIGHAEVRRTFKVSNIGTIAGCYVTDGKITRNANVRLVRDGVVVHEGKVDTLKRFKDDVREVAQGYECGVTVENFNDIKEGDIIEAFIVEEVAPSPDRRS